MKFVEIIKTNNWLSVASTLLKLYPNQGKNIEAYKAIFSKLQKMKPLKSKTKIVVEQHYKDKSNSHDWVEVSGSELDMINGEKIKLLIEFTPWREWLGMEINGSTLKQFNETEILSHCLCEMTYAGFNEGENQNESLLFDKAAIEYEKLTDNGRKEISESFDDLLDDLSSNFKDEVNSKPNSN